VVDPRLSHRSEPVLRLQLTPVFDAHTHLDRHPDPDAWPRAREAGVTGCVIAAVGPSGWDTQRRLAADPHIAWTVGLHPWWVADQDDAALDQALSALTDRLRAANSAPDEAAPVGIGELGLDAHRPNLPRQERAFIAQLALAAEVQLPLVLHIVGAHTAALDLLGDHGVPEAGGMVHSFGGSPELARRYLDLGLHLSFSGSITRTHARRARASIVTVPPDRLLLETDAPDQCPEPWAQEARGRGEAAVGEPSMLNAVLAEAAALRGEDTTRVAGYTAANARRLFGLPALE